MGENTPNDCGWGTETTSTFCLCWRSQPRKSRGIEIPTARTLGHNGPPTCPTLRPDVRHAPLTGPELARKVAHLKDANRILRAQLPERLIATPQEQRRLLRFGRKLGQELKELVSIVRYQCNNAGSARL